MAQSLRRSRRALPKREGYRVDDIVEVVRAGATLKGRLAQPLTDGTSPNPRWLVKFDGQPHKDEEMYERSFVRLLSSVDDDDEDEANPSEDAHCDLKPGMSDTFRRHRQGPFKNDSVNGCDDDSGRRVTSSSETDSPKPTQADKDDGASSETPILGSDEESTTLDCRPSRFRRARNRVSAREARSRRRQAKIDEDVPPFPDGLNKRRIAHIHGKNKKIRADTAAAASDAGELVKVKLLTGTLLLYRGAQRRVEFVRRV